MAQKMNTVKNFDDPSVIATSTVEPLANSEPSIIAPASTVEATIAPPVDVEDSDVEPDVEPPADVPLHVFNTKNGKGVIKRDPVNYHDYHIDCAANFDNDDCLQFLRARGFVDNDFDTLRAFGVGFDPKERRLVIPHSDFDHTARTIADGKPKFKNPSGEKDPVKALFNAHAFVDNDIVAVTEAAIDALSLIVCGIPAVGAHGTGGTIKSVLAAIDQNPRPRAVLIGFDNDKAGNDASEMLAIELDKRGVLHDRLIPPSDQKDFNDALRADRAALTAAVEPSVNALRARLDHQRLLISARQNPIAVLDRIAVDILSHPEVVCPAVFSEHGILAAVEAADKHPAQFDIYRKLVKRGGTALGVFDRQIKKHQKQAPRGAAANRDFGVLNQPSPLDMNPLIYVIQERLSKYKKSQAPIPCLANFDIILDNDPSLKNLLGYNYFSQRIEMARIPDWYSPIERSFFDRAGFTPTLGFVDSDDALMQNFIDRRYHIRDNSIFQRCVVERAHKRTFHPVQDYFHALPPWDGIPRAERLFIDNLGADDCEYTRAVTRCWLIAACARAHHPGSKFDYALVLQGKQGIGKSTILSLLGGKWFGELDSIQGKDAVENLQGKWLIELCEMQATKKAENEQIKAFISRQTDFVRLPYERRARAFPRQCVLAATTNESEVLRDQTGGRRFWIVECRAVDFGVSLRPDDVTQIWAEVFHLYNQLFADAFDSALLDLPSHLKVVARELQASHTDGSDLRAIIAAFLDRPVPRYEFWRLLTKDERRDYCHGHCIYLPYERIISAPFKLPCDRDELRDNCITVDDKRLLPLDGLGDKHYSGIDRRFIFGDGKRMKVSPIEVLNECFDGERSRLVNPRKIADLLRGIDGWQYQRGAVNDPYYGRQMCSFVRVEPTADNPPEDDADHQSTADNELDDDLLDEVEIPF